MVVLEKNEYFSCGTTNFLNLVLQTVFSLLLFEILEWLTRVTDVAAVVRRKFNQPERWERRNVHRYSSDCLIEEGRKRL